MFHTKAFLIHRPGFSLAEVLVALVLLGVLAALTIPTILRNSNADQTRSKICQATQTLEEAWYAMKAEGNYQPGQTLYTNLTSGNAVRLNAVSQGNAYPPASMVPATHPCTGVPMNALGYIILPGGTYITGLHNGPTIPDDLGTMPGVGGNNYFLCVDVNGGAGPNTFGRDVFWGNFNPSGDFDDTAGTVYSRSEDNTNFFWGSATQNIYCRTGNCRTGAVTDSAGQFVDQCQTLAQ